MKFKSLAGQVLGVTIGIFLFTTVLIVFLSTKLVNHIVYMETENSQQVRLDTLTSFLNERYQKVRNSGLEDLYGEGYKKRVAKDIGRMYQSEKSTLRPFVRTEKGEMLLGSDLRSILSQSNSTDQSEKIKTVTFDKKHYIISQTQFLPWGWTFGYVVEHDEVFSAVKDFSFSIMLLMLMISVVFITAMHFFLRKILKPIAHLSLAAREIGNGNYNVSFEHINASYEIASLLNAMKFMSRKLGSYTSDLKNEVEKQTQTIQVQEAALTMSAKLAAIGEMAGGVAHEINNPLAIITSTSKYIQTKIKKNTLTDQVLKDSLEDIDKTVLRISKIITGLRTISRDSSQEKDDDCRLKDVLDDVLGVCSEKFKIRDVELTLVDPHDILKMPFSCKRVQLSQVILNLLNNAHDAIEGMENKWIKIFLETSQNKILIHITDSGSGIPQEVVNKMFQPFFTTKEIGKGTGLGLSLSKSIIERHHGSLYVDSSCENTSFVIELPLESNKAAA
jgi:C4-dicarboxylate-specific signal transduction histidine kinase